MLTVVMPDTACGFMIDMISMQFFLLCMFCVFVLSIHIPDIVNTVLFIRSYQLQPHFFMLISYAYNLILFI